jgi:hypothetical protein
MKKLLVLLVGFMGLVFLAGCATSLPKTGFLGQYAEKLEPGPEGGAKMRWLKPGVDWAKYNKFMVDYVVFALSPDSEYKGIDGDEMKKLGDSASKAIVDAIKAKYPVVAEPGPDVVRLRFAIVNLKQSYPVLSGITSVVPIGLGISIIKKGATGAWTGSGATEAELLTLDSQTNEVIAAAYDEYTAGFTERFTKWGSVDDAFKYWGERVVDFAENVKGRK